MAAQLEAAHTSAAAVVVAAVVEEEGANGVLHSARIYTIA